jgi:DNA-binding transcriptional regulator YiaG
MPNIVGVMRDEIIRLSRREIKKQTSTLQKMSAIYRRDIAALKRQVATLERVSKQTAKRLPAPIQAANPESPATRMRFVAKGFRSMRHRLGLSAAQLGVLLGVSEQSIYNWESQTTTPRRIQLPLIARVRTMGKREALAMIDAKTKPRKSTSRR